MVVAVACSQSRRIDCGTASGGGVIPYSPNSSHLLSLVHEKLSIFSLLLARGGCRAMQNQDVVILLQSKRDLSNGLAERSILSTYAGTRTKLSENDAKSWSFKPLVHQCHE